jgi:predicted SprT family Zn-dependent metalloprotease
MPKKKDRMAIEHEIAMLVFKQRGLTTDGMAWKEIQQEIFSLKEQRSGLVYN